MKRWLASLGKMFTQKFFSELLFIYKMISRNSSKISQQILQCQFFKLYKQSPVNVHSSVPLLGQRNCCFELTGECIHNSQTTCVGEVQVICVDVGLISATRDCGKKTYFNFKFCQRSSVSQNPNFQFLVKMCVKYCYVKLMRVCLSFMELICLH